MKDRELTAENQTIRTLSEKREQNGCKPVEIVSRLTQSPSMEGSCLVGKYHFRIYRLSRIDGRAESRIQRNRYAERERMGTDCTGIDLRIDLWMKHIRQVDIHLTI